MNINTTYMEMLNRKDSKINNIFFKMIKLFSHEPDVIQIGVGGYSSSGKTVLIDAMFSIFDKHAVPKYMPQKAAGIFLNAIQFIPTYKSHSKLRADVSNSFHEDHATTDDGQWNENMHCAKLQFSGKEKILLIRNIPGEMFQLYYKTSGLKDQSLKTKFESFIDNKSYSEIIKNIYNYKVNIRDLKKNLSETSLKNILKNNAAVTDSQLKFLIDELGIVISKNTSSTSDRELYNSLIDTNINNELIKKANKKTLILLLMYQMRSEFMLYINNPQELGNNEKNFFAFLFYITANFNVYCVKSANLSDQEITLTNENILNGSNILNESNDKSNFAICITQFDKLFLSKKLPDIEQPTSQGIDGVNNGHKKLRQVLGDLLGNEVAQNTATKSSDSELTKYWLIMNKLYEDLDSNQPTLVDPAQWESIRSLTQVDNDKSHQWFCTSVAYNFVEQKFFGFSKQTSIATTQTPTSTSTPTTGYWTLRNNNNRTPIGVLELLLYILLKNGCEVNKWALPFPDPKVRFQTIRKKMGIQ